MKNKLRFAIDLDDTCSNFVMEWIHRYNMIYDDHLDYNDITEWEIENFVKCTPEEMYAILDEPNFFRCPVVEDDCRRVISRLKQEGHDVFIVTATYNPDVCSDKSMWIKKYLGLEQKDIVYAIRKELIKTDVIIDDGAHNIKAQPSNVIKVLFARAHNHFMQEYEYDVKVKNWNDIETYCELRGWL